MSASTATFLPELEPVADFPVLETGDRLNTEEFMRRFERMPDLKKAELIDGIVYIMAPTRETAHSFPDGILHGWLVYYAGFTPGVRAATNGTAILDEKNTVQPDAYLRKLDGSSSRLNAEDYLTGAPELVLEVAASSASLDAHKKKEAYRRAGVAEYILYRTTDHALDWWVLVNGQYELLPFEDGLIRSRIFPELVLNVTALLAGDTGAVLITLQNEIAKRSA